MMKMTPVLAAAEEIACGSPACQSHMQPEREKERPLDAGFTGG